MKRHSNRPLREKCYSRRDFLRVSGNAAAGISMAGLKTFWARNGIAAVPACQGYLLVDAKKCQGCLTCMITCSLVHHGHANLSHSRIQVTQNPFAAFPDDLALSQCRQCVAPACVDTCPVGALTADPANGYVRTIDPDVCVGCMRCVNACPYAPSRAVWNAEDGCSEKCDLCANTPYWNDTGGAGGNQACIEACPLSAIAYASVVPVQDGDAGYIVNLRGASWAALGYPVD